MGAVLLPHTGGEEMDDRKLSSRHQICQGHSCGEQHSITEILECSKTIKSFLGVFFQINCHTFMFSTKFLFSIWIIRKYSKYFVTVEIFYLTYVLPEMVIFMRIDRASFCFTACIKYMSKPFDVAMHLHSSQIDLFLRIFYKECK